MLPGGLLVKNTLDSGSEFIERAVQAVSDSEVLEMEPKALNGIEKGAVLGKPDDEQTVGHQVKGRLNSAGMMVGSVIHDQNKVLVRVGSIQLFEKGDEGFAVLAAGR